MTAQRTAAGDLAIRDADGDRINVYPAAPDDSRGYVVMIDACFSAGVGLTFDDGLALLQALADALKVERYEPGATS